MNLDFATVHSLMNYTNLIDSCQSHLPCNTLRTSNSFARSDTGVVIDSKPHPSRTCKTSLLFAPLAVVFKLAVPLFCFTLRRTVKNDYILNTKLF